MVFGSNEKLVLSDRSMSYCPIHGSPRCSRGGPLIGQCRKVKEILDLGASNVETCVILFNLLSLLLYL
jgi:hypothetical protein